MYYEEQRQQQLQQQSQQQQSQGGQQIRQKPYYPECAGLGLDANRGHCRQSRCPVCTVFGFANGSGQSGGFAGLASFSDAHVLLFPVPTRQGPMWVSCPMALRLVGLEVSGVDGDAVYLENIPNTANQSNQQATQQNTANTANQLNLGWLLLPVQQCNQMSQIQTQLQTLNVPDYIRSRLALVPDRLFAHIVNSNLEVRTSVSINPATGAAEEGALFSYEALPRSTVLVWEIIAKNPAHFRLGDQKITAKVDGTQRIDQPDRVHQVAQQAHPYLEHLGIGGMGTRGMGRLKVLYANQPPATQQDQCHASAEQPSTSSTQGDNSHE
jgi:CRISPR-associated protein Cmr4